MALWKVLFVGGQAFPGFYYVLSLQNRLPYVVFVPIFLVVNLPLLFFKYCSKS